MKILVASDSHGDRLSLLTVLERCEHRMDMFVFLGDGVRDAEYALSLYPRVPRVIVRGNCDMFADADEYPEEALFEADGVSFLAVHGHRLGVKGGLGSAAKYAHGKGADVLLYGHTHRSDDTAIGTGNGDLRAINPGSIGRGGTFALVETVGGKIVCGFAEV